VIAKPVCFRFVPRKVRTAHGTLNARCPDGLQPSVLIQASDANFYECGLDEVNPLRLAKVSSAPLSAETQSERELDTAADARLDSRTEDGLFRGTPDGRPFRNPGVRRTSPKLGNSPHHAFPRWVN
jgi:hypothetical protein